MTTKKFNLGQLFMTEGIQEITDVKNDFLKFCANSIERHLSGDWGDLEEEDKESNNEALENRGRLLSSYNLPDEYKSIHYANDEKIWIITEWDRSYTTILLPTEY